MLVRPSRNQGILLEPGLLEVERGWGLLDSLVGPLGIHHLHVQACYAATQGVVRRVAAAALNFGPHPLPAGQRPVQSLCSISWTQCHVGHRLDSGVTSLS